MRNAQLAQLVEQGTENPCVSGSIPELGTFYFLSWKDFSLERSFLFLF